jgi:hypothetical protein
MTMHQNFPELLPPAAADCAAGVRLIKIHEQEKTRITDRSARSTYPKKKSVLTSETTPVLVEFPSMESATRWYESPAYQEVRKYRIGAAEFEIVLVDGGLVEAKDRMPHLR